MKVTIKFTSRSLVEFDGFSLTTSTNGIKNSKSSNGIHVCCVFRQFKRYLQLFKLL